MWKEVVVYLLGFLLVLYVIFRLIKAILGLFGRKNKRSFQEKVSAKPLGMDCSSERKPRSKKKLPWILFEYSIDSYTESNFKF